MSEYAWIIPGFVWLCLNVPKFVLMAFVLHSPIGITYLKEHRLFSWKVKIWFFYSSWKYLILFFVFRLNIFTRFEICCYLWGPKEPGTLNLTQPLRYPINKSMMLFQWFIYLFCSCCFSSWKYLILFFVFRLNIFTRFEICCYLWGPKGPGTLNLTQPLRYPVNKSMMLFQWFIYLFCYCCFFTFWHFKGIN